MSVSRVPHPFRALCEKGGIPLCMCERLFNLCHKVFHSLPHKNRSGVIKPSGINILRKASEKNSQQISWPAARYALGYVYNQYIDAHQYTARAKLPTHLPGAHAPAGTSRFNSRRISLTAASSLPLPLSNPSSDLSRNSQTPSCFRRAAFF